jgi:hypothetical protein
MPLDDYRRQTTDHADFDYLGHCADRYGVSLTAATLKWLEWTDERAVFVGWLPGILVPNSMFELTLSV